MTDTLVDFALDVLNTADAKLKAQKTMVYAARWRDEEIDLGITPACPNRPKRPEKPELLFPRDMPKRKKGNSDKNKINLLHALSHIELNAIDLAWDIIARFSPMHTSEDFSLPIDFYNDWLKVADDEAKHFLMLSDRLSDFGAAYGDLPAHDGLWESAEKTAHDFAARLAVVPMVLEARGLDVTPDMISLMKEQGDQKTADMLQIIYDDEITHVRAGTTWFQKWCDYHQKDVETYFQELVRKYFHANLKKPFNHPGREESGMIRDWYEPLAEASV
ncbi:MAG TPA: ferritin-like domain-containing protein [Alphaproteobacteria bacterium]|nr:ferritin-like domain-containing protein [Alphaproteobacteria bacterium]